MNKMLRKRILIPLLPPQEPGINGVFCLRRNPRAHFILTFLSFRRDQEDAGTFAIPFCPTPSYTHHLFSGASPTRLLPINVDPAFTNGKLQASIHSL